MQNDIEITVLFSKDGETSLAFNGTCCLGAYPGDGFYWKKNIKKTLAKLSTVQELLSLINGIYDEEVLEESSDMNLREFDGVVIEEVISGDFSYFELESIDSGEIDPNDALKVVFAYDFTTDKEKKRKIYAEDCDGNWLDVTAKL